MAVKGIRFEAPDLVPAKRALLSVSDKTGIVDLATALNDAGVLLISTGGTRATLEAAGLTVSDISDLTGFPEIMDGRVKTLHPNVHGGLLGIRADAAHQNAMDAHNISGIDLLIVNLYPFEETRARGADFADTIENVDIGGPAMVRAGAKNHAYVTVVTDPDDYADLIVDIKTHGGTTQSTRKALAAKAFSLTASYDAAVSNWLISETETEASETPKRRAFGGRLASTLRYGENPHQTAAFYVSGDRRPGVATAKQVQGKALSFNNINDTNAAFELVSEFSPEIAPAVAIIKHANPCGVATGSTLLEAYERALLCDPVSAFGGIVALNGVLDEAAAAKIVDIFTEVIIAPDATDAAKAIIAAKANLRLLLAGGLADPATPGMDVRSVAGGYLVQNRDNGIVNAETLKVVTKRAPTPAELSDLLFAFKVAKHVKSNAIVYAKDGGIVGIGAGQMSRVDSVRIAARKAEDAAKASGAAETLAKGAVVASDAFFPFADGLIHAAEAGATAIIQPGGSMRDDDVIDAADQAGLAMVFTGMRHFRH